MARSLRRVLIDWPVWRSLQGTGKRVRRERPIVVILLLNVAVKSLKLILRLASRGRSRRLASAIGRTRFWRAVKSTREGARGRQNGAYRRATRSGSGW